MLDSFKSLVNWVVNNDWHHNRTTVDERQWCNAMPCNMMPRFNEWMNEWATHNIYILKAMAIMAPANQSQSINQSSKHVTTIWYYHNTHNDHSCHFVHNLIRYATVRYRVYVNLSWFTPIHTLVLSCSAFALAHNSRHDDDKTVTSHAPFSSCFSVLSRRCVLKLCSVLWMPQLKSSRLNSTRFNSTQHDIIVKLPQPQPRARTYTQTCQSTLRATQVRPALSHAYAVTYQNRITDKP
jgi:hypothetical protein